MHKCFYVLSKWNSWKSAAVRVASVFLSCLCFYCAAQTIYNQNLEHQLLLLAQYRRIFKWVSPFHARCVHVETPPLVAMTAHIHVGWRIQISATIHARQLWRVFKRSLIILRCTHETADIVATQWTNWNASKTLNDKTNRSYVGVMLVFAVENSRQKI